MEIVQTMISLGDCMIHVGMAFGYYNCKFMIAYDCRCNFIVWQKSMHFRDHNWLSSGPMSITQVDKTRL